MERTIALILVTLASLMAWAEAPPAQIVKPVAKCDEKNCVISKSDWEMLKSFHERKFIDMEQASELLEAAQQEIAALRGMLARFAGGCNKRHT